jgi:hypothetical protein
VVSGPISDWGRARLRAIREGELRERGVGGEEWLVTRESGEGVGEATVGVELGTAAALIGERPAGRIVGTAPNTLVGEVAWEAIIIGEAPQLQPEDMLTSVETPTLAFRLRSVVDRRLHETWEVAPQ